MLTVEDMPENYRMLRQMCRDFADKELAPNAARADKMHEFPESQVRVTQVFHCKTFEHDSCKISALFAMSNALRCEQLFAYAVIRYREMFVHVAGSSNG